MRSRTPAGATPDAPRRASSVTGLRRGPPTATDRRCLPSTQCAPGAAGGIGAGPPRCVRRNPCTMSLDPPAATSPPATPPAASAPRANATPSACCARRAPPPARAAPRTRRGTQRTPPACGTRDTASDTESQPSTRPSRTKPIGEHHPIRTHGPARHEPTTPWPNRRPSLNRAPPPRTDPVATNRSDLEPTATRPLGRAERGRCPSVANLQRFLATWSAVNGRRGGADEPGAESRRQGSSSRRTSSVSAPSARPAQRISPGVRDRRATGPCITTPSTSTNTPRALHVRIGHELAHRVHGRDRGLGRVERGEHLGRSARAPTHAPTIASSSSRCSARLSNVAKRGSSPTPSSVEHAVRDRLGRRRDRDPPAVGAAVGAARHRVRDARPEPRLLVAEVRGGRRQRRHHLQHRLEQVDVDHLPAPLRSRSRSATITANAPASAVTSSVSAIGGSSGGAVGLAVDRREPAHRLGHRGEAGLRRVRPVLAEAGHAQHDEARVAREQHVGAEAEALERAGPEVLDEHVGVVGEARAARRGRRRS